MDQNFKALQAKVFPEVQGQSEDKANQVIREMALDEMQGALDQTQQQLTEHLHVNQADISKVNFRSDVYISTHCKIIEAMRGQLDVRAMLPDGIFSINRFEKVRRPVIILDTSVINRLAEDKNADPIISGLKSVYAVRLTATNLDEICATPNGNGRAHLLDVCKGLRTGEDTQVLQPFGEIVKALIAEFERNPAYDWRAVRVSLPEYERMLAMGDLISDELSRTQRVFAERQGAQFEEMFSTARPHFEDLFRSGTEMRPSSPADLVSRLRVRGGAFWSFGMELYRREGEPRPVEDKVRKFVDSCPPFHALLLAFCVAQYHRCVQQAQKAKKPAGGNDLLMAVYLPYCEEFVSDDRDQQTRLREIVSLAKLPVKVRWYREFRDSLSPIPLKHNQKPEKRR
jgi:hypothetical protein